MHRTSTMAPLIFRQIQEKGSIESKEMFRTFNMGIGMVLILNHRMTDMAISFFKKFGQDAWVIGEVSQGKKEVRIIEQKGE